MTNTRAQAVIANYLMFHTVTDTELEAFVMAATALDEEWISVEDKLPEDEDELVIVCDVDGEVSCARYYWREWHEPNEPYYALDVTHVTHWRHLPKGPEVD